MAEALYETLHKMSLFPAHVIGLSLGGMVAQMLVVRHPLAVASLVLCDTICEATLAMDDLYEERAKAVERGRHGGDRTTDPGALFFTGIS